MFVITSTLLLQYIITFISFSSSFSVQTIIITNYFYENNTYHFLLYLGYPGAKLYKPIHLNMQYTTTYESNFLSNNSKSIQIFHNENIKSFQLQTIIAKKLCDNIIKYKNSFTLKEFCIYSIPHQYYISLSKKNEGFGFAYFFSNETLSLVHQLFSYNQISKRSFAFVPPYYNEHDKKSGIMLFGGLDMKYLNNRTYYTICSTVKTAIGWGCVLDHIFFDNEDNYEHKHNKKTFGNIYYSIFQTSEEFILAPEMFHTFYMDYIKSINGNCDIIKESDSFYIQCDINTVMNKLKSIDFLFEHSMFRFKSYELFRCGNSECFFKIRYHESNSQMWVFGTAFLDKYVSEFDYDNYSITFYGDEWLDFKNRTLCVDKMNRIFSNSSRFGFICIVIVILLIDMSYLSYFKYVYNK